VYYVFLKGVLYLIHHLPTSYGRYILISAKQLITLLPLFYVALLSAIVLFAQFKFTRRRVRLDPTDKLIETVRDEADERAILNS